MTKEENLNKTIIITSNQYVYNPEKLSHTFFRRNLPPHPPKQNVHR